MTKDKKKKNCHTKYTCTQAYHNNWIPLDHQTSSNIINNWQYLKKNCDQKKIIFFLTWKFVINNGKKIVFDNDNDDDDDDDDDESWHTATHTITGHIYVEPVVVTHAHTHLLLLLLLFVWMNSCKFFFLFFVNISS